MLRLKCFGASGIPLILGGLIYGCAVHPASSTEDARITDDVKKAIAQQMDLRPPNQIYVETHDGVVRLSGLVIDSLVMERVEAVAGQVSGVRRVTSTVSVDK